MPDDDRDCRTLRARPRVKVFQPVELRIEGTARRGHLLDVSASGALVHAPVPPLAGASVVLVLGTVPHAARVMWLEGTRFGLAFTFRLSEIELERILAAAAPRLAVVSR